MKGIFGGHKIGWACLIFSELGPEMLEMLQYKTNSQDKAIIVLKIPTVPFTEIFLNKRI